MKPSFSILTTVKNSKDYVLDCLESVRLCADEADYEVEHVVVDRGSNDDTERIIEEYASNHSHVRFLHIPGTAKPRAANEALSIARNDFVGNLEADEIYNPGIFSIVAEYYRDNPGHNILVGSHNRILENGEIPYGENSHYTNPTDLIEFWKTWGSQIILPWRSTFYKRKVHDLLGPYFEQSESYAYEFLLRASQSESIHCLAERFTSFRTEKETPEELGVDAFLTASKLYWKSSATKTAQSFRLSFAFHRHLTTTASLTNFLINLPQRIAGRLEKVSRSKLAVKNNHGYFSKILRTPPIEVNPNSSVEIHSVCGKRDFYMLLFCLKSFLRYKDDVRVVVHNDGSLDEKLQSLLHQHIPGSEVFSVRENPDNFDELAKLDFNVYKAKGVYTRSKGNKIIMLDSDMIFLRKPSEILAWIDGDEDVRLYGLDIFENHSKYIEITARSELTEIAPCFNAGLVCFFKEDLDKGEFLKWVGTFSELSSVYFAEQVAFCFLLSKHACRALPRNRYVPCFFNDSKVGADLISDSSVHLHFMGDKSFTVHELYRRHADQVFEELIQSEDPVAKSNLAFLEKNPNA